MGNVYLWKVEDNIIFHANLEAAEQLNGLSRQPDMTVTEAEYHAAGGLVRVIDGSIVLGKTDAEQAEDVRQEQIAECKAELAELDKAAGAGRSVRDLVITMAEQSDMTAGDAYTNLKSIEDQAAVIRVRLSALENSV